MNNQYSALIFTNVETGLRPVSTKTCLYFYLYNGLLLLSSFKSRNCGDLILNLK